MEILTFSLKKNAFESVVCKISAILSWPQCVNLLAQNHLLILICKFTTFGCVLVHCLVCITDSYANLDRVIPIYLLCGLVFSLNYLWKILKSKQMPYRRYWLAINALWKILRSMTMPYKGYWRMSKSHIYMCVCVQQCDILRVRCISQNLCPKNISRLFYYGII